MSGARPLGRLADCKVPGCEREGRTSRGLCRFHDRRLRSQRQVASLSDDELACWASTQSPQLCAHQFCLSGLEELVRVELLFALQRRDEMPPPLSPAHVRMLVNRLGGVGSIRRADHEAVGESGGMQSNSVVRGLFRHLRRHLERAWADHTGIDAYGGDIWEIALLDLRPNGSRRWPATEGVVDFRVIELDWLREVIRSWGKDTRPYVQKLRQALLACRIASQALVAGGASDPSRLGPGHFAHVVTAISEHHRADGTLYSAQHRNQLLRVFTEVVDYGRSAGLMAQVPDPFARGRHRPVVDDPNEDELGKAIPESVIRQLDAHIDLLGPRGRAGSIGPADLQFMHQTVYRLLRDTGRRPGEVVSLELGCVETIDGQVNLIYDNHKAGRMRRRLPITMETADVVLAWQRRRVELVGPAVTQGWMFPSPMLRARQSVGHLTSAATGKAFREWVAHIDVIDSDTIGPDGTPLPYARSLVIPYALRHSYAQRHADAGVPVDVLKELMDHRSVQTTMGYYRISLRRKQEAIRAVGSLAVDAAGNPSPLTSPLAYERASVSVPFGNCTEPSNVKAGGGHCPIRFQCAGCGFYRPDPSYLPAIEAHIANLRADEETARAIGAADYVIANMSAEIDAFGRVAEQMHRRLAELDPDERAEVEASSRILRRARAARRIPVVASPPGHTG